MIAIALYCSYTIWERGEVGGRGAGPCSSAFVMMKSAHKENDEGGHNTDLITRLAGPLTISGG